MGLPGLIKKLHDKLSALPARVIGLDHRGTLLSYQTFATTKFRGGRVLGSRGPFSKDDLDELWLRRSPYREARK
jgi:hypothetical protein